jgi:hypothetical protein
MGEIVEQQQQTISEKGITNIHFKMPEITSSEAEGMLTCVVRDSGVMQSITKTIPVLAPARDLIVDVYPESGPGLVEHVQNRIYVEVSSHRGDPADIEAEIVEVSSFNRKIVVATIRTTHEGRGRSTYFVPDSSRSYNLVISKTSQSIPLHFVEPYHGVVVSSSKDVYEADDSSVEVHVKSTHDRSLRVGLFQRERQIDSKTCDTSPCHVRLSAASNVFGTLRVTVFGAVPVDDDDDHDDKITVGKDGDKIDRTFVTVPLAERLIFRRPHGRLNVEVKGRVVYVTISFFLLHTYIHTHTYTPQVRRR